MTDEVWRRHANPWSVWTRFAAIPAMIAAIWSRTVVGWWALVPVGLVAIWLWLNPRVFPPVTEPRSWAAKGIYGEKLWLEHRKRIPPEDLAALNRLIPIGIAGFALLTWGLIRLLVWPTVLGAGLIGIAQLLRIDRLGQVWDKTRDM